MKLATSEDIDRPIGEVYAYLADFSAFEDRIRARGIDLRRCAGPTPPDIGANWAAPINLRERGYDATGELVTIDPNVGYAIEGKIGGVVGLVVVDLLVLEGSSTRMFVSVELTPTSLSSRVLIQSLKLTKGSLSKRFASRVATLADEIRAGA